jgi:hypothetical protein
MKSIVSSTHWPSPVNVIQRPLSVQAPLTGFGLGQYLTRRLASRLQRRPIDISSSSQ